MTEKFIYTDDEADDEGHPSRERTSHGNRRIIWKTNVMINKRTDLRKTFILILGS